MVGATGFRYQFQVPLDGSPLAFRADPLVAVDFGIDAVVDVAAVKQAVVFTMGDNQFP